MYTQVGGMVAKTFDDYSNDVLTKFKALDDNMLSTIKITQEEDKKLVDLEDNVKSLFELKDQLAIVKAETLNFEEQHKFRDEVARKLDLLASLEDSAVSALKARMITKVKADVLSKFKSDAASKEAALASVMSYLASVHNPKHLFSNIRTPSIVSPPEGDRRDCCWRKGKARKGCCWRRLRLFYSDIHCWLQETAGRIWRDY